MRLSKLFLNHVGLQSVIALFLGTFALLPQAFANTCAHHLISVSIVRVPDANFRVKLETPNLKIEEFTKEDFRQGKAVAEINTDPENVKYTTFAGNAVEYFSTPFDPVIMTALCEQNIPDIVAAFSDPLLYEPNKLKRNNFTLAVREKGSDKIVGVSYCSIDENKPGIAAIGYMLTPSMSGRGFGTEMGAAMTRLAFEHFQTANIVEAHVHPQNLPSVRVAQKIGMHVETIPNTSDPRTIYEETMVGEHQPRHIYFISREEYFRRAAEALK